MAKEQVEVQRTTTREGEIEKVELEVEKRDIRANLLAARKKQLLRRKRGYGKLPGSLRR
jgi:hypothetical protein|tara:strand:+ start:194 stop:370 length:177 start_codon:yes stop_codon:yes gene_type:complete